MLIEKMVVRKREWFGIAEKVFELSADENNGGWKEEMDDGIN